MAGIDLSTILIISVILLTGLAAVLLLCCRRNARRAAHTYTDAITGGLGADGFFRALRRNKKGSAYSLVVMKLRNYPQIRQAFDTEHCREVLRHIYRTLSAQLGKREPCARMHDGVFAFILQAQQEEAIRVRLSNIFDNINRFNELRTSPFLLDLCFGVCIADSSADSPEAMQARTLELIESTRSTARYLFCKKTDQDSPRRRWELAEQLERSLADHDFIVYLQPKVQLGDNRIFGAEALVRWRHPIRGLLTPGTFIPVLEEHHLMQRVDKYIFTAVCKKLSQWKREGIEPCPISINFSREHLHTPDFAEEYAAICREHDLEPALFEFELSESFFYEDVSILRQTIDRLHAAGFGCALDNFGKSFVPLHLLRELEINTLKLDSSFFDSESNNRRNRITIEAILKMASQLQIRTVAEGIDNESQIQYLRQAACDAVQGFFYFRPMPMDEFRRTAYTDGRLRYIDTDAQPKKAAADADENHSVIMFSWMPEEDVISFSHLFSPLQQGEVSFPAATSMFRHSNLIHENDRKDFFRLLERCQKEDGWVENTLRFYTADGHYDWLEVNMHRESTHPAVISGVLVNTSTWRNEVDRWREKANRDALTSVYNREYFESTAAEALKKGNLSSAAMIFVDMDNFKQVNDTLGHMVGDDVICYVAKRLLGAFRHSDVVARYGGDEFVVFATGIGKKDLENRLTKLWESFQFPYRNGAIEYPATCSIGAAVFPEDGRSYKELLDRADTAVYIAKERGKNGFVLYEPGMETTVSRDEQD